jgi:DNA-directed RNA polymerase II subunit RPB2
MERDSLLGHGAMQMLKERMVECSDIYVVHVCDKCGLFASKIRSKLDHDKRREMSSLGRIGEYECISCGGTKVSRVILPYVFKLLVQELMAMNVLPRLRTTNSIN